MGQVGRARLLWAGPMTRWARLGFWWAGQARPMASTCSDAKFVRVLVSWYRIEL